MNNMGEVIVNEEANEIKKEFNGKKQLFQYFGFLIYLHYNAHGPLDYR